MAESAIERTSRALDLIPFIHQNPGYSISELAEIFETTAQQLLKDLEMLFMCGLPGYSHLELIDLELDENYVAVNNPQNLGRPRKLSFSEIAALTLGLEALLPISTDQGNSQRIKNLQERLFSLVTTQYREQLSSFTVKTEIATTSFDSLIHDAIAMKRSVKIAYRPAKDEALNERTISPIQIYSAHGFLYCLAYCSHSEGIRHFRHDRIEAAEFSQEPFLLPEQVATTDAARILRVRALLSKVNLFFIEEHQEIITESTSTPQGVETVFELGDREWLFRALTALPGSVSILEPQEFADGYQARLDAILELYR